MRIKLYSIQDIIAEVFKPPFPASNEDHAKRMVKDAAKGTQLAEYPQDFRLYCMGTMDDHSGIISGQDPVWICNLTEIIQARNEQQIQLFPTPKGD